MVISRAHEGVFLWVYVSTRPELPVSPPFSESPSKSTRRSSQSSIWFPKACLPSPGSSPVVDSQHTVVSCMEEVSAA